MTAELVRGQNHPLPQARLEIRVSAGKPIVAGATLSDEQGTVHGVEWVAHPGSPTLPGLEVSKQAAADHRLAVDLGALSESVHRVSVLLALPLGAGGPVRFGAVAAPFVAVTGLDGSEVASYTITDLDAESAVVALELYRRQGGWKVRAVGQGYAGGLAELLADQGLPQAQQLAGSINEAVAQGLARSVAAPSDAYVRRANARGTPRPRRSARTRAEPRPRAPPGTYHRSTDTRAGTGRRRPALPGTGRRKAGTPERPVSRTRPPSPSLPRPEPADPSTTAPPAGRPPRLRRLRRPRPRPSRDSPRSPSRATRPAGPWKSACTTRCGACSRTWPAPRPPTAARSTSPSRVWSRSSTRSCPTREAASADRATPHARRPAPSAELIDRAREALDRDLAQLTAEAEVVEPALPPAFARWDNPVWHGYRVPMEIPMALRLGDLHLPESAGLSIPMLVRLPLERGLWIDSGRAASPTPRSPTRTTCAASAMDTAVAQRPAPRRLSGGRVHRACHRPGGLRRLGPRARSCRPGTQPARPPPAPPG